MKYHLGVILVHRREIPGLIPTVDTVYRLLAPEEIVVDCFGLGATELGCPRSRQVRNAGRLHRLSSSKYKSLSRNGKLGHL